MGNGNAGAKDGSGGKRILRDGLDSFAALS